MLKINKANFLKHLKPALLVNKHIIISASLKTIDTMHIQIMNLIIACNDLNYIRINEFSIEASSHKKPGNYNLPNMTSFNEDVYTLSCVYSIDRQYISFDTIDLSTKKLSTELIKNIKNILPKGWELMQDL